MKVGIGGVCLEKNTKNGCASSDVNLHSVRGYAIASQFNKMECINGNDIAVIELKNDLNVSYR